jgi:2,5-diketo-D-gluconate reductase A
MRDDARRGPITPTRAGYAEVMTTIPTLTLNDGHTIPQIGFGTFQVPPERTAETVRAALDAGYRHLDTAEMYGNERGVGEGVRASGLAREEVFITSKLANGAHAPDDARRAFDGTIEALGFDYVDLFLIHWPLPRAQADFVDTWRVLESFVVDGRARSIGVSNFQVAHLERLAAETGTVPAVNQIEVHPLHTNDEVRAYDTEHGILTEAWSPLAQGAALMEPTVTGIAERVGRTPAQVVMRWHLQRGDIVFPKTMSPARMRENLDVLDFELTQADQAALTGLDQGEAGRTGPHPEEVN